MNWSMLRTTGQNVIAYAGWGRTSSILSQILLMVYYSKISFSELFSEE